MPQVLLVNPITRKGAAKAIKAAKKGAVKMATARKKPRTAAQKRATAKLVAMNKARRAGSGTKRRAARKTTRKVRRSNPVETVMSNPKRRRRSNPKRRSSKTAATHAGRVLRYRRRNPVGGMGEFLSQTLVPSAIGGGGALLLDIGLAVLPIPATMKVGAMAPIVRIAGAVGIGALAGMVTSRKTANQIAAGAMTVTLYQIMRGFLARSLPAGSVPGLSAPPFYDPALPGGGVGEYVGDVPELGYIQSGQFVGDPGDGTVGEYVNGPDDFFGEEVDGYETGVYR